MENHFFDPTSGWEIGGGWGYPKGHLSFGETQVSIKNFATDNLAAWSISRGLGAVENPFFDPTSGWKIGGWRGGEPQGSFKRPHLKMGNW